MTEAIFQAVLAEFQAQIDALPAEQQALLTPLIQEATRRHHTLRRDFALLRDLVDDWRLTLKYLIYDLEQTRNEVQQLRRKLNEP